MGIGSNQEEYTINFYKGNASYDRIDNKLFLRKLNELQSGHKRVYRLNEDTIKIPLGQPLNLEEYFTVQNQFPAVYGIGVYGLAPMPAPNVKPKPNSSRATCCYLNRLWPTIWPSSAT
ncbi:MAG: hypothetical protein HC880_03025 [Bacteroidia bacterium]|nr:hypothetical protein [Bacteroidia bacterium]